MYGMGVDTEVLWDTEVFWGNRSRQLERTRVAILEASDSREAGGSHSQGRSKGDKRKSLFLQFNQDSTNNARKSSIFLGLWW